MEIFSDDILLVYTSVQLGCNINALRGCVAVSSGKIDWIDVVSEFPCLLGRLTVHIYQYYGCRPDRVQRTELSETTFYTISKLYTLRRHCNDF